MPTKTQVYHQPNQSQGPTGQSRSGTCVSEIQTLESLLYYGMNIMELGQKQDSDLGALKWNVGIPNRLVKRRPQHTFGPCRSANVKLSLRILVSVIKTQNIFPFLLPNAFSLTLIPFGSFRFSVLKLILKVQQKK